MGIVPIDKGGIISETNQLQDHKLGCCEKMWRNWPQFQSILSGKNMTQTKNN